MVEKTDKKIRILFVLQYKYNVIFLNKDIGWKINDYIGPVNH